VTATLTAADLAARSAAFERAAAEEIVAWAAETFGDGLCLTTSLTDAVLLDLAARVAPGIEVIFLDTQYHFAETLATLDVVRERYPVRLNVRRPDRPLDDLWRTDTDACCHARKVVPLEEALKGKTAWLSGLRRADSPERAVTPIVEHDRRGLVKVNPIATWSDDDVALYIQLHDVPVNPLVARGYPSIGCWPCTQPVAPGADPRAGRWAGTAKTECGLHL
jgi:phosphoadenosine phosphosulfate reductase